jgi:hypothetical protein
MDQFADHGHYHSALVLLGATLIVDQTLATRGYGGIHREQLYKISLSCLFTLINIFDGLVVFVPLVEVASVVHHVSFSLMEALFSCWTTVGEITSLFSLDHDVLLTTFTWLLHGGFMSCS